MEEKVKDGILAIIFYELLAILFTLCGILLWFSRTADLLEKIASTIIFSIFVCFLIFAIISTYKDILEEIEDYKNSMLQDTNKLIEKQNKENENEKTN